MGAKRVTGRIVRFTGQGVWVNVDGDIIPTLLRGKFRRKGRGVPIVAGDMVEVDLPEVVGAPGTIENVLPRNSWLSKVSGARSAGERVIVANIDTLFFVVAARDPRLNLGFVDRVLVSAERGHNHVVICINKIDLMDDADEIDAFETVYTAIGYAVARLSAATGEGVDHIVAQIKGGVYAFIGQSGVGKSSLLNHIDPSLDLRVAGVAGKTGRGRHTTTTSRLFPIRGGYMADTPGMQTFGYPGTDRSELADCFPEFRDRADECRFQSCTHSHEPGCEVKVALEAGEIAGSRYRNYLDMLGEIDEREKGKY